jgi:putative salt-induced outer membrane protein
LRADIIGNLALVLSYRLRHNSDVPAGTEKTDRFTAISLEYGF